MLYEYYISTKKEKEKTNARVFTTEKNEEREKNIAAAEKKRTRKVGSIITRQREMLAKQYRLRTTNDFKGVFKKGRGATKEGLMVRVKSADRSHPRIGIIVSKKVAKKAVARNRIRRIIGEAIRPHLDYLRANVDVVVVVLPDFEAKKTAQAAKTLHDLFKQVSLLK